MVVENASAYRADISCCMDALHWCPVYEKLVTLMQLRECAAVLLMKLLDDQVPALTEGTQLLKALNVLMLKILDNCSR